MGDEPDAAWAEASAGGFNWSCSVAIRASPPRTGEAGKRRPCRFNFTNSRTNTARFDGAQFTGNRISSRGARRLARTTGTPVQGEPRSCAAFSIVWAESRGGGCGVPTAAR